MGLFTNRKRDDDPTDVIHSGQVIEALEPTQDETTHGEPAPDGSEPLAGHDFADDAVERGAVNSDDAAPFVDEALVSEDEATRALAEFGITLEETAPAVPPGPRRALTEQPTATAQAGNVEIDALGLLEMLGVDQDASLIDISDARLRFLAEHDPVAETDAEAAEIKERIRRQVNVAYASFRLTHAD